MFYHRARLVGVISGGARQPCLQVTSARAAGCAASLGSFLHAITNDINVIDEAMGPSDVHLIILGGVLTYCSMRHVQRTFPL